MNSPSPDARESSWHRQQFTISLIAMTITIAAACWLFSIGNGPRDSHSASQSWGLWHVGFLPSWFVSQTIMVGFELVLALLGGLAAASYYFSGERMVDDEVLAKQQWQEALGIRATESHDNGPNMSAVTFSRVMVILLSCVVLKPFLDPIGLSWLPNTSSAAWLMHVVAVSSVLGVVWLICCKRTQRLLFLVSNMAMAVLPLAIAARCSIQWLPISFDVLAWAILMITIWWIAAESPPWLDRTKANVPIRVEPYLISADEVIVKPMPVRPGHPAIAANR